MSIRMLIVVKLYTVTVGSSVELGHELQHSHVSANSKCVTPCPTGWAKGYHPTADTAVLLTHQALFNLTLLLVKGPLLSRAKAHVPDRCPRDG